MPSSAKPSDLIDDSGARIRLGEQVGRGGQGTVYEIIASSDRLAKIYHDPVSARQAQKIRAMASLYNFQIDNIAAWPTSLLLDQTRKPIGFVMPRVGGRKDIHKLYSPKSRRSEFVRADFRMLVRVALNTARTFAALHKLGIVIGDINHGSVLVGQDATVRVIDCDSFQARIGDELFSCDVGQETFTPSELQGVNLKNVVRTENQDAFGLAVLVFLLLFMGRHPFAGRYLGPGYMPISQAIREGRFAYGVRRKELGMEAPPNTPSLSVIGDGVADLFERAFDINSGARGRPSPLDWINGLSSFERNLAQCTSNSSHWHFRLIGCPWCPMEAATGVQLFPFAKVDPSIGEFDLSAIWKQIDAINHPGPPPTIEGSWPSASDAAIRAGKSSRNAKIAAIFVALVIMGIGIFGGFKAPAPFLLFVGAIVAYFIVRNVLSNSDEVKHFRSTYDAAFAKWTRADQGWKQQTIPRAFDDKKAELVALKERYGRIPSLLSQKLDRLRKDQEKIQLTKHLDRFQINEGSIEGIGKGRKQTLASYGIETAADLLSRDVESVPGFGPVLCGALYAWRRSHQASFIFDSTRQVDPADIAQVHSEIAGERRKLEQKMVAGVGELQHIRSHLLSIRVSQARIVEAIYSEYQQAKVNYDACQRL